MQMQMPATCPQIIEPEYSGMLIEDWTERHGASLDQRLYAATALLFRGFSHRAGLETMAGGFFSERLGYTYRSTPRTELGQHIYTATEYPRQLSIPQHCENAYQTSWPMKLLFHCVEPASSGGCTPLADMRKVTAAIAPEVRALFRSKQVRYVRNYRAGVDLPWQEVFGSGRREVVEAYCRSQGIHWEWIGEVLRTSQVCQAFATHPVSGDEVWFNQAHLFHVSALDAPAQEMMLATFKEEGLPRHAYFGDGTPIPADMLAHVRAAFDDNKCRFDWRKDDVLLIDNMLVSHGRDPYEGARKVLVCMAEPYGAVKPAATATALAAALG
ncbi:TauD/TfdA family dioxygenase [Rugamonas sp. CCM 8940]|uniref:TauD/TfdA family dioxygenase n=1 Tax=Rugamonas sp. CCM 8940 TaxID=2765359 RepID=UPI0018F2BB44|nr:TauD/TfdA family dioxygenase [Rugamonas sp. CCM 8940]MBJ7312895.1 TauD/TfdA family dioxygenase [Rugamonas sp. CCM 8940]